jgi:hypothetical protein
MHSADLSVLVVLTVLLCCWVAVLLCCCAAVLLRVAVITVIGRCHPMVWIWCAESHRCGMALQMATDGEF